MASQETTDRFGEIRAVDKETEDRKDYVSLWRGGEGGTVSARSKEPQDLTAIYEGRYLANENLLEKICERSNLNQAYKRVKRNKGSPGIDGMTVEELGGYLSEHKEVLIKSLLNGTYKPQPVKKVMIPKPGGGERQLGIPTVVDRFIQQAIHQVLAPIFEPRFSSSNYGFRPKLGAHDALKAASGYVSEGSYWVVDIDLEKYFDRVNHDILMSRISREVKDKSLLKVIGRSLRAGIMHNGVCVRRQEGTPQGSPLSPLLSNIMLDELDKELERRGHKFCRYADDCNIYVRSKRAGERVYESIKNFLELKLRLKVNEAKSKVALVNERKFLGYRLRLDGGLMIAPESLQRFKAKLRIKLKRNRPMELKKLIREISSYLCGWFNYFKLASNRSLMEGLDGWIRRKLRCFRLKQKKRAYTIAQWLMSLGLNTDKAWRLAKSSKGWWRLSRNPVISIALPNSLFAELGLYSLLTNFDYVKSLIKTAVCD